MKIANLILTSQNGGAEQVFIDYTKVLKNLGHEIVAIIKDDAPYGDELLKLGVEPKKISNSLGFYDFIAVKKLKKILEEENVEAVFAHMGRIAVLAHKAISKIPNKEIILIAINHSGNVKRSIGADIILSVNRKIFYSTIDAGQSENASFVIPNAIDLSDAPQVPAQINFQNKNPIIVGVIGRLDRTKGFDLAIKALKILEKNSDKNFVLKFAGSGYYEKTLRDLVKKLNLENKVEFLGWIKDKKAFFDSIDIFCLPSKNEPFGLVVLEAMKYRKPIISSNADGPKEILRDGVDGLIFNIDQDDDAIAKELAQTINKLASDSNLAHHLIDNSFARLQDKFSFRALEARLKEIVGKVGNSRHS